MTVRHRLAFATFAVVCGVAAAVTLSAQTSSRPAAPAASHQRAAARTPDGHPDFQGIWANNTVTPLQRPKQWEGKERLTEAEIADLQKIAAKITENDGDAQFGDGLILAVLDRKTNPGSYDPGTGNYNQFWVVERDWHDRRTSLITDPPNGRIPPMTPDAQKRRAAEIEYRKAHAFEDPEVFPAGERCVNFGLPRLQAGLQQLSADRSGARLRHDHERDGARRAHHPARRPAASRQQPSHLERRFARALGRRHARHRHDELLDQERFHGLARESASHRAHHARRRRHARTTSSSINDPTTWTAPWTAMIPLKLKNEMIFEYACHEGNDAIPDMLRGHRFEEREAAAKTKTPSKQ